MTPSTPQSQPSPRPRWSRWRRRLIFYPLLFLAYNVVVIMGCADRLILHPSRDPVSVPGAKRIEVPLGKERVEVWIGRSPGAADGREPRAFVLQFIGNADRAEYSVQRGVEQWGDRPVEVWAVNYPGYGGSTGRASMKSAAAAGLAAYDALRQQAGDRPIFVSGLSFGTTAGLHVAANRPVAGMLLQNPPPLRQLVLGKFGWWNLWLLAGPVALGVPSELDSIGNAGKIKAPGVFVIAGADEIVPPKYQRKIFNAYAGEKRAVTLEGARHNDLADATDERNIQAGIDWLWTQGGVPPFTRPATNPSTSATGRAAQ